MDTLGPETLSGVSIVVTMGDTEINAEDFHTAVLVFAHFIGIDIENELHLLYIAEDALSKKGLPSGWAIGIGENESKAPIPYFYNEETGASVWNHPREAVFMRKVKDEKAKDKAKKEAAEINKKGPAKSPRPAPKKPEKKAATSTSSASSSNDRPSGADNVLEVEDFDDADAVEILEEDTPKKPPKKSGFGMRSEDIDDRKPSKPDKEATKTKDTWASASTGNSTSTIKTVEGPPVSSRAAKINRDRAAADGRPRPNTSAGVTGARDRGREDRDRDRDNRDKPDRPGGRDRPASSAGAGERPPIRRDDRDRERDRDQVAPRDHEREREREERERARDRERESALRARDRDREREARERDRDREREQMGKEIDSRVTAERRRTDEEKRRANLFEDELEGMRDKLRDIEGNLSEERERRRKVDERLASMQTDYDARLGETVDTWEERLRRTRDDVETEMKEKIKSIERRNTDDMEELRGELKTAKAKAAESTREAETAKRKLGMSKEEGKMESQGQVVNLRGELEAAEEVQRVHQAEMRRLREDNVELGSKLAAALQSSQVAVAEAEMAKAQASNVVAEGQSSHTALVQATTRLQDMDTDMARLRGELLLQKKEADAAQAELNKLRGLEGSNAERINLAEAESRKARIAAQSEVMRLQSRVTELVNANEVITQQLDRASTDQAKAVREVERSLDKALFDMTRLQDKLRAEEAKSEMGVARIVELEKQLLKQQDLVYKKEKETKEEKLKSKQAEARAQEVVENAAKESHEAQGEVARAKKALDDLRLRHSKEIDDIRAEVHKKLPELSTQAANAIEKQFQGKLEDEVGSVRRRYELSEERFKREILDMQTGYAEREARARVASADDRAELEHLRNQNSKLTRQVEDLETQVDEVQLVMKAKSRALLLADKERFVQAVEAAVEGGPPPAPPAPPSVLNASLDRDDSAATDRAVYELQQQLAMMKTQLGAALERTVNTEARRDGGVPYSVTKSAYSSSRPQQVTFSPESLFMSPDAKTVAAALSAAADTARPEKSAVRFASTDDAIGTDDPSFIYMASPAPNNKSAIDRSYAAVAPGMPNPDGADVEAKIGHTAREEQGETNDVGIDDPQFEGIHDGGFHEGYWKARYAKAKKSSY